MYIYLFIYPKHGQQKGPRGHIAYMARVVLYMGHPPILMRGSHQVSHDHCKFGGVAHFWTTPDQHTLWWTYKKLLKMAIEIVDFPINSMVIFHGKMLVHQRVLMTCVRIFMNTIWWRFGKDPNHKYIGTITAAKWTEAELVVWGR